MSVQIIPITDALPEPATISSGDFGLAMLSIVLILLEFFAISYLQMYKRMQVFNKDHMERFAEEHHRALGTWKPPTLGYPDMGNGRYSKDLTYEQWFTFNNWQRCHYNFLESLTPIIVWILLSSVYQPFAAGILGLIFFVGRIFYTIGYMTTANNRLIGAILVDISLLGLFILSLVSVGKLATA